MNKDKGCLIADLYLLIISLVMIFIIYYIGARNNADAITSGMNSIIKIMMGYQNVVDSTIVSEEPETIYYLPPGVPKQDHPSMRSNDE